MVFCNKRFRCVLAYCCLCTRDGMVFVYFLTGFLRDYNFSLVMNTLLCTFQIKVRMPCTRDLVRAFNVGGRYARARETYTHVTPYHHTGTFNSAPLYPPVTDNVIEFLYPVITRSLINTCLNNDSFYFIMYGCGVCAMANLAKIMSA